MKLTRYGKNEIILLNLIGIGIILVALAMAAVSGRWWVCLFCILGAGTCGFALFFFRDPQRAVPEGTELVVAPADGTVTEISEVEENKFLGCKARKVGIFLSLLNVHINRSPYRGTVEYLKYKPGKFLNAGNLESSVVNESNGIGIVTSRCKMLVRQISGIIARRIVCGLKEGDNVETGEKFGMIKFGSRTELYVPVDAAFELQVELGQKVKAGETVIGAFRESTRQDK